jgi:very-short-patch-repair endonuclease
MSKKVKLQIARSFRKNPTKSEKIMWGVLRRNNFLGLGFRRQHIIKGFIVDFYCHQLKLVIEIDGPMHKYQLTKDWQRQKIIEDTRIKFYRIKSKDIENDIKGVLKELDYFIKSNFDI